MESGAVIKGFDVVKDGCARLGICGEALMIDQLVFETAPEGFDEGLVVAVAFPAHRGGESVLSHDLSVSRAGELTAAIRMEDEWTAEMALV